MDTTHYCFPQPNNPDDRVWKYIDLAKLIYILSKKQLYLTRLDLLSDQHEGTLTKAFVDALEKHAASINNLGIIDSVKSVANHGRLSTYVNCWRLDTDESEAMWKLYCPNNQGVALQTTYSKLANSIKDDKVHIGTITYIDYESGFFQAANNLFYSIMHKRKAFEHEKEVRIVTTQHYMENKPYLPGKTFDWNISEFIESIYVNPYADSWYYDIIIDTLNIFNCNAEVKWSDMKTKPYI